MFLSKNEKSKSNQKHANESKENGKEQAFGSVQKYIVCTLLYMFKSHVSHFKKERIFNIYIYIICIFGTFFHMFNSNYFTASVAQLALINIAT
jgi:hypothetical protein